MTDPLQRLEELLQRVSPEPWVKAVDAHSHGHPEDGPCYAVSVQADSNNRPYLIYIDDADESDDANASMATLAPTLAREGLALARAVENFRNEADFERGIRATGLMFAALESFQSSIGVALGAPTEVQQGETNG